MDPKLIIFDIDGTLADWQTGELLPNVKGWFDEHAASTNIIGATNQGGVSLRLWMLEGNFGEPHKYPTEEAVREHIAQVQRNLDHEFKILFSFAYQSFSSGKWAPTPASCAELDEWRTDWRKPAPGMLLEAMRIFDAKPEETLMVGDWDEDREAAEAAGCAFQWADVFFDRGNIMEWFDGDKGESIGKFPLKRTTTGDFICPKCGKPAQYSEGQIDEDRMGNAIHGWWFDCWSCKIGSDSTEGGFGAFGTDE